MNELKTIGSDSQPISGNIRIGVDWTEISPPDPLKAFARIHKVAVRTDAVETFDENDQTAQNMKFKNGERGKVEAVLFDEQGTAYELSLAGIGGTGGGFYLGRKRQPAETGKPPDKEADFPFDRRYIKLKIRSDVPFQSEKIEWIAEIQK